MRIYDFFTVHGLVFELLIAVMMFIWKMERRESFLLRASMSAAVLMGMSVVWSVLPFQGVFVMIIRYMLFIIICMLGVWFSFQLEWNQATFFVTGAGITQHFVFKVGRTLELLTERMIEPTSWMRRYIYPLYLLPLYLLCYMFFARKINGNAVGGVKHSTILFLTTGMLLCTDLFQNLLGDDYYMEVSFRTYLIFQMFGMVTCLFLMALMRALDNWEKSEQNIAILHHMLYQQKQQMEVSKETMELINIKCHDLKHQISLLGNHIPQEEIEELSQTISIYDSIARTDNEALDVLIAEKSLLCQQKRIQFDYMADGKSLSFMKAADIYSMFGNALDNAMEAVGKIEDPQLRYIGMKVSVEKGMLMIRIENRYDGRIQFRDGIPQTTKEDKRYHGFGVKSIRMITDKYHGYLSLKAKDGIFVLNILLPLLKEGSVVSKEEDTV